MRVVDLVEDLGNVRRHSERNIDAIKASLQRWGQQKPIVIDAKNVIRAGNGTFKAAKALGWEKLDCVRSELSGSEMAAFAIADNRTAELADWSAELSSVLESLSVDLPDLDFGEMALDGLCNVFDAEEISAPELNDGDRAPFQQMTFTLHDSQAEIVKAAIDRAKTMMGECTVNENSNGNALYFIAEAFSRG